MTAHLKRRNEGLVPSNNVFNAELPIEISLQEKYFLIQRHVGILRRGILPTRLVMFIEGSQSSYLGMSWTGGATPNEVKLLVMLQEVLVCVANYNLVARPEILVDFGNLRVYFHGNDFMLISP